MTSPRFEQTIRTRYHELDCHGRLRPVMLLNYLQDCAGLHARRLGISVIDLRKNGYTWVISRIHLLVQRYPRADETVTITTWPSTRQGLFSCREFQLQQTDGTDLAKATTSWAVLNMATRRPVRLSTALPEYPLDPLRMIPDDFTSLPPFSATAVHEHSFRVLFSDLDSNQHVNNTVIAGWALESLPETVLHGMLVELEISYRAEVLYGDTVIARAAEAGDGVWLHQIVNALDGRELALLRTRWSEK